MSVFDMSMPCQTIVRRYVAVFLVAIAGLVATASASASTIVARNAVNVRLAVDTEGHAAVTYRERGRDTLTHLLAWGAINATPRFRLDYAGGWGAFRRPVWKRVDFCGDYDGPPLTWVVAACKAPDGSYWALQSWQRMLPNQGYEPRDPAQSDWELHLSHWRGQLPYFEIYLDWIYGGKYHHLFGRYTYLGRPVHGFKTTSTGVPLDPYGRNVYLDTYGSAYGPGWRRENSFLAHQPNGNFCYGFFTRKSYYDETTRPAGNGTSYRATAMGPGVAPDVYWTGNDPGPFDPDLERRMNALGDEIAAGDPLCRQH